MNARRSILVTLLGAVTLLAPRRSSARHRRRRSASRRPHYPAATTPVAFWSTEARCAIVPAGPGGVFGSENFGNKFPGEAAVYMGIVHVAIFDAAVAIEGGYRPYASRRPPRPPDTSPGGRDRDRGVRHAHRAAATAGRQPDDPRRRLRRVHGRHPRRHRRSRTGSTSAAVARRPCSRRARTTAVGAAPRSRTSACRHRRPASGNPGPGAVLGLCLPGMRPLALRSASQFRPAGPNALTSQAYADDFNQVKELGRIDSASRTPDQTDEARFWTDHDMRQWNDGLLRLAAARASTSSRPRGCWRWRTSRAATR